MLFLLQQTCCEKALSFRSKHRQRPQPASLSYHSLKAPFWLKWKSNFVLLRSCRVHDLNWVITTLKQIGLFDILYLKMLWQWSFNAFNSQTDSKFVILNINGRTSPSFFSKHFYKVKIRDDTILTPERNAATDILGSHFQRVKVPCASALNSALFFFFVSVGKTRLSDEEENEVCEYKSLHTNYS